MMQFPPDLLGERIAVQNSAVAGTNVTNVILPAPGASQRIRLWGTHCSWRRSASGDCEIILIDSTNAPMYAYMALSDECRSDQRWFQGGMVTAVANRGISVQSQASVASTDFFIVIHYTIEAE